jgi:hypothetical protein
VKVSFITGSVGKGKSVAVLGQLEGEDDEPLDVWRVGFWTDGEWRAEVELDFKPVAVSGVGSQAGAWVILGIDGEVLWVKNAGGKPDVRADRIVNPLNLPFTTITPFGAGVVAGQMGRGVYWSDGGEWRQLGRGMPADDNGGVEALASTGNELYACGWNGEIWCMQNDVWFQVESPTNVILTGASADAAGNVVACGRLGLLLRGRHDRWATIDHKQTDEDFWSVASFRGRVFVSSLLAIYELAGNTITRIDDDSAATSYYHISSNEEILASVGARAVLVNDGEQWQTIIG